MNESLPADIPETVGAWKFDPDRYNGFAWVGGDAPLSVHVHPVLGRTSVTVADERVSHSGGRYYISPDGTQTDYIAFEGAEDDGRAAAFDRAVEWMGAHDPQTWSHPAVTPAVFDAPPGYALDAYQVTERQVEVWYSRSRDRQPDAQQRDTLYVGGYHSSDNYQLVHLTGYDHGGLPLRADDPAVDFAQGTPLDAAIARSRVYAVETVGVETAPDTRLGTPDDRPPAYIGQSALTDW